MKDIDAPMQAIFLGFQVLALIAGICFGGSETKAGGAFLLISFVFMGLGVGWYARAKKDKEGK